VIVRAGLLSVLLVLGATASAQPIVLGLNADMSTVSGSVGSAIQRGATLAIEELNAAGGVLGRTLELRVLDHRMNPARGEHNVRTFATDPDVVAILGGKHTTVVLGELETIHALGIPYLIPWAAGTPLIDHGFEPSYTFRVSVRDADAAGVLVAHAVQRGFEHLGLLLEQTGWGRSNEVALRAALAERGMPVARVEWFNWAQQEFAPALQRLTEAGADAIVVVINAPEGVSLLEQVLAMPPEQRLPLVSHWGIIGDEFEEQMAARIGEIDLSVLHTFSFFDAPFPDRAAAVAERYLARFEPDGDLDHIVAAPAVAHAYDLVHLLAAAIERAGTTDRAAVRDALEQLGLHEGLVRDYNPPFTSERHDALGPADLRLGRFVDGVLLPLAYRP